MGRPRNRRPHKSPGKPTSSYRIALPRVVPEGSIPHILSSKASKLRPQSPCSLRAVFLDRYDNDTGPSSVFAKATWMNEIYGIEEAWGDESIQGHYTLSPESMQRPAPANMVSIPGQVARYRFADVKKLEGSANELPGWRQLVSCSHSDTQVTHDDVGIFPPNIAAYTKHSCIQTWDGLAHLTTAVNLLESKLRDPNQALVKDRHLYMTAEKMFARLAQSQLAFDSYLEDLMEDADLVRIWTDTGRPETDKKTRKISWRSSSESNAHWIPSVGR